MEIFQRGYFFVGRQKIKGAVEYVQNIEKQKVITLKSLVDYMPGQVVSKTLAQNDKVIVTVFSFDKGEEISTHAAGGDAMGTVLEGVGKFTVDGVEYHENPRPEDRNFVENMIMECWASAITIEE